MRVFASLLAFTLFCQSCVTVITNQQSLTEQGPGPLLNGQTEGLPNNPVAGAVSFILPDPEDPAKVFLGTVNGGIWKTNNANAVNVHWETVSDKLPSLSISSLTYADFYTGIMYASVATKSSFLGLGGPLVGVLKSADGGNTWNVLGNGSQSSLVGKQVNKIACGHYNQTYDPILVNGEYTNFGNGLVSLYAATTQGLYISFDENIFNRATQLPARPVTDVISLSKGGELYVAIPGDSVYISTDFGQTFTSLNVDVKNALNVKLAVTRDFVFVAQSDIVSTNTFCKVSTINRFDLAPLNNDPGPVTIEGFEAVSIGPFTTPSQSGNHFSFLVHDLEDGNVDIYIGGVVNKNLFFGSTGQSGYSGRVFMGKKHFRENIIWKPIVGNGAFGTAPHADSRHMAIDADGDLLQACDGGVYKFFSSRPEGSNTRKWISINHDLRVSEVTSVGWDALNNAAIAGLQDNGSAEQTVSAFSPDQKIWTDARLTTFFGFNFNTAVGDGYSVNVDNQHSPPIRYIMQNHFTSLCKREYGEINPAFVFPWSRYPFNYGCLLPECALNPSDINNKDTDIGLFPFELNQSQQSSFVIGARAIYEFKERGDQMFVIDSTQTNVLTSAIAYGHPTNNDLIYYSKLNDMVISKRTSFDGGWLRKTIFSVPTSIPDMAIDIDNPDNLFITTSSGQCLKITNFSTDQMAITNLNFQPFELNTTPQLINTINSFKVTVNGTERSVLLVGCVGGVYIMNPILNGASWIKIADNFPNVFISDVKYYPEDDILVIGTLGRGVWTLQDFSTKIPVMRLALRRRR